MRKKDDSELDKRYLQAMDLMFREKEINHKEMLANTQYIHGYAIGGIKALLIINAGALTALPVYWKIMNIDFISNGNDISYIIMSFILGIIFAMLTLLFAYLTECDRHQSNQYNIIADEYQSYLNNLPVDYYPPDFRKVTQDNIKKWNKEQINLLGKVNKLRMISIIFAILSLISFCYGGIESASLLKTTTTVTHAIDKAEKQ